MADGEKKPIESSLIARVSGAINYMFRGVAPTDWMSPGKPIEPVAPDTAKGREFDFPVGFNTTTTPRSYERVSFSQMRALADGYDLLRLVIETRKDQLEKLNWKVVKRDGSDTDERVNEVTTFLTFPDRENTFHTWARMLVEDMLVIDAPTIYPRFTRGGKLYSLDLIDGATIKRVLDGEGRTPIAPDPAYQQIIKGVPAANYSTDELIYYPRNKRTHKVYGFSPVEQIIMTVNIALRRQLNQLQYYTEGNTPNLVFGVPQEWTPEQIKFFQGWWDQLNSGETKHKAKFVPGGVAPHDTKAQALKDEFDEWLARVVCFAFSIPATAFIKQTNRSVAEQLNETAQQEGLLPIMNWLRSLMNLIVWKFFGYQDLEFVWDEEFSIDPEAQARIDDIKIRNASRTLNEVRKEDGKEPIEGGDVPLVYTSSGPVPLTSYLTNAEKPPVTQDSAGAPAEKVDRLSKKKAQSLAVERAQAKVKRITKRFLRAQATEISKQLGKAMGLTAKAEQDRINEILSQIDLTGWAVLAGDIEPILERIAVLAGKASLLELAIDDEGMLSQVNLKALQWAKDRAAELVGMKILEDGTLVENPNAQWAITESTREMLRGDVVTALEEGWSNARLADEIADNYAFSDARAEMIARTEIARADSQGNLIAWDESDVVVEKAWQVSNLGCCDACEGNQEQGRIPFKKAFQSGDQTAPAHPNCRCVVVPFTNDDESDQE